CKAPEQDVPPWRRADELGGRSGEATQIVRALPRHPPTPSAGRHYRVTDVLCEPKPVQPELPILVGATGDRMLGIVARHADMWNCWGLPDRIAERSAALTRRCEQAGRDPAEIAPSAQGLALITAHHPAPDRP